MKTVLDTNVIISGLLWKGECNKIIDLALNKKIKICVNKTILEELFGVLSRQKFQKIFLLNNIEFNELKDKIIQLVFVYPDIEKLQIIKDDLSDNMFLECAIIAQAKYIVSGDLHLKKLEYFQKIPILSPNNFLKLF